MYPQLTNILVQNSLDATFSNEMIESCSKCYVATMPCADMITTDTEQKVYYKTDISDGYCEEKKGNLSYTPGPHLMRIHLVRYSTSAKFGKNPKIFT